MARGNGIIVSANPQGIFKEGVIASGQTPKPGTVLQMDPTVALVGNCHTFKIYDRVSSGNRPAGALWVLLPDSLQGKLNSDAYAAGDRAFLYCPQAGEELNMLLLDITGEDDDHTKGELLAIDDTTGKLVAYSATVGGITNPTTAATLSATADAGSLLDSATYFATYAWKKNGTTTLAAPTQAAGQAVVSGTNKLTLTIPAAPTGVDGVDVFISTAAVGPYFRVRTDVTPATTIHVDALITAAMKTIGLPNSNTGAAPQDYPFQLLETVTNPTADTLAWVSYGG